MLRRSMPYTEGTDAGLVFVCFANSPTPFKQQLARMVGKEDGVTDGLFRFSRPLTGAYYWCPAVKNGKLDLSKLSIK
jgi:putative iron-dependent peroxidase